MLCHVVCDWAVIGRQYAQSAVHGGWWIMVLSNYLCWLLYFRSESDFLVILKLAHKNYKKKRFIEFFQTIVFEIVFDKCWLQERFSHFRSESEILVIPNIRKPFSLIFFSLLIFYTPKLSVLIRIQNENGTIYPLNH